MVKIDSTPNPAVVRAAGGIVWRLDARAWHVAVIHRPKYRDWSLPKGKLESGESWKEAAVREVWEETGCKAEVASFAGTVCYLVKGRPKVVLFWNMIVKRQIEFHPTKEVDRLAWLLRREAIRRLNHSGEKRILLDNPSPTTGSH